MTKLYKVDKSLIWSHQAPKAWYETLSTYLIRKWIRMRQYVKDFVYQDGTKGDISVQPKLGLWYLRDSPFDLEAFSDSDYAGASLDRKSTIGGSQFLGKRLISWQCKKQTIVANSTTEAEYVAAANCCGQGRLMVFKCSGLYTSAIWIEVGRIWLCCSQVFKDGFNGCIGLKMLFGLVLRVKYGKKLVSAVRLALCCWAKCSYCRKLS
ncbi:hypothetical protein Tco_0585774 [Tanacetum coccineum]